MLASCPREGHVSDFLVFIMKTSLASALFFLAAFTVSSIAQDKGENPASTPAPAPAPAKPDAPPAKPLPPPAPVKPEATAPPPAPAKPEDDSSATAKLAAVSPPPQAAGETETPWESIVRIE